MREEKREQLEDGSEERDTLHWTRNPLVLAQRSLDLALSAASTSQLHAWGVVWRTRASEEDGRARDLERGVVDAVLLVDQRVLLARAVAQIHVPAVRVVAVQPHPAVRHRDQVGCKLQSVVSAPDNDADVFQA